MNASETDIQRRRLLQQLVHKRDHVGKARGEESR